MSCEVCYVSLPGGIDLWTRLFNATDPGTSSPALLMLHGTAETGDAYRQWIPHLAREFRIVCPDLRGMGRSTRISPGSRLDMNALVDDVCELMRTLGIERYSVVGEKVGALLALRLAARHPDDVQAMALACGMIAPRDVLGGWVPGWIRMIEESGVRAWVDATQAGRMGDELSPRALEWWSAMMAASDPPSLVAYLRMLQGFALTERELRDVRAPTLFLVPSRATPSGDSFDQRRPAEETQAWQRLIRNHLVAPIDSASYHLAATRPDACALAARSFLIEAKIAWRRSSQAGSAGPGET